jgi:superoxide dismutase, Fe-Mn family
LQSALKFNGGGHINHCIFWTNLCKDGSEPSGHLLQQINKDFGSVQSMKDKLSAISIAIQGLYKKIFNLVKNILFKGSGWGWLGYNKEAKRLELACCPNQDPLEPTTGLVI